MATDRTPSADDRPIVRSSARRGFPGVSLYFYWKIFRIVNARRRLVVAGRMTSEDVIEGGHEILRLIGRCGAGAHVTGEDVLRQTEGPVVFAANHMSTLETLVLPALIIPFKPITYVVKKALVENTFFGPVMRWCNPITVTRTNPRRDLQDVLTQGQTFLENGTSVLLFPQRTRDHRFDANQFNSIGVKLARRAGTPVVPIALKTDFWGNGRWIKEVGPVHPERDVRVRFGPAVTVDRNQKEAQAAIVAFMADQLSEWGVPVTR